MIDISSQKMNGDFLVDTRVRRLSEVDARDRHHYTYPWRTIDIKLPYAIPVKLYFYAPQLIGVNVFAFRPYHGSG